MPGRNPARVRGPDGIRASLVLPAWPSVSPVSYATRQLYPSRSSLRRAITDAPALRSVGLALCRQFRCEFLVIVTLAQGVKVAVLLEVLDLFGIFEEPDCHGLAEQSDGAGGILLALRGVVFDSSGRQGVDAGGVI